MFIYYICLYYRESVGLVNSWLRFKYLGMLFRYAFRSRDSYFSIAPIKTALSILSITMVVRVVELGGYGLGVSGLFFMNIFAILSAGYLAPYIGRLAGKHRDYLVRILVLVGLLSLYYQVRGDLALTLLSAFLLLFTLNIFIYMMYVDVGGNYFRDKWSLLSRLESIGGFYWSVGLGLGIFISFLLGYEWNYMIVSLLLLSLLTMRRSVSGVSLSSNGVARSRVRRQRHKYLLVEVFMINFGVFVAYTQLIPYLSNIGVLDWEIYGLSFLASTISLLTYNYVGSNFRGVSSLSRGVYCRLGTYTMILFIILFNASSLLYFAPLIYVLLGYSWGYITISLGSYILMYRDRDLSMLYLVSGLGGGLGAIISGFFVTIYSYSITLTVSMVSLLGAGLLLRRFRIYPSSDVVIPRIHVVEHTRYRAGLARAR